MCGIAGFLGVGDNSSDGKRILDRMGGALKHRGPDDNGVFQDLNHGVGLVHRRLEIVGIGQGGHQPMTSMTGRFVICFNGEIYNFRDLGNQLTASGYQLKGQSDTEVFLGCIELWGLELTLDRVVGMFAFALFDRKSIELTLVRDRIGEKPLYYSWMGKTFLFSSELGPFRTYPDWRGDLSRDAIAELVKYSYIPEPRTIFNNVSKLEPATIYRLGLRNGYWGKIESKKWWKLEQKSITDNTYSKVVDDLDGLLNLVIKDQYAADVPVGTFLSGGVDSSLITSVLQNISSKPIRTYTVGFENSDFDETSAAKQTANALGTDHTDIQLSADDVLSLIPSIPNVYDEPFADSSQIPTLAICQFARSSVKVVLSGDGADELFGGYNRYLWGPRLYYLQKYLPNSFIRLLENYLLGKSPYDWDQFYASWSRYLPASFSTRQVGEKFHKFATALESPTEIGIYRSFIESWNYMSLVLEGYPRDIISNYQTIWDSDLHFSHKMMSQDLVTYLQGDILTKVDRASMSIGLETRIPYLDHRIIEYSQKIPISMLFRQNRGKQVLRSILERYLPRDLAYRPKSGFSLPIHDWLRGPLRGWAEELLSMQRIHSDGIFDGRLVQEKWLEHVKGNQNNQSMLWPILMIQAWLESNDSVSFS